jgi:hypothetical protein
MSLSKVASICVLAAVVALGSVSAYGRPPVRQSSDNGIGSSIQQWMLLESSLPVVLTAGGKSVTMTREILCPQQDQSGGSCSPSGNYMYVFQLQSTATNVTINIGKLQKGTFKAVDQDGPIGTYGFVVCNDDPDNPEDGNSAELCTEDPNDPGYNNFSGITFAVKGKTGVQFTIPSFPSFPPGNSAEGQGLTIYIVTTQSAPIPIIYPSIGD